MMLNAKLTENAKFYLLNTNVFEGSIKLRVISLSNILYISIETQKHSLNPIS